MISKLKEIYRYRHLIVTLVFRELAERYKRAAIGFLWALVEPLGFMIIYMVVFSFIVRLNIPDYPIFLLCGLLPWIYFSKSLTYCTESIMKDSNLVKKIYFPREILPISSVFARFINFIISLLLLVIFLLFFRNLNPLSLVWLMMVILLQTLLSIGLALIFSSLNVYFQDVKLLIDFLVLIWFYASPVFYPLTMVPARIRGIYILNPTVGIISSYQNILYFRNTIPLAREFYIATLISTIVFFCGMVIFKILDRRIGELV